MNVYECIPFLPYKVTASTSDTKDVYNLAVGFRTVKVEKTRFLINDKPFYFKGLNMHEDSEVSAKQKIMYKNLKKIEQNPRFKNCAKFVEYPPWRKGVLRFYGFRFSRQYYIFIISNCLTFLTENLRYVSLKCDAH